MRISALPILLVLCWTATASPNQAPLEVPADHVEDNLLTRWKKPIYPSSALRDGITGSVTIEFDSDKHGGLTNVRVVDSKPPGVFDEAVMRTLSWWTIVPFRARSCYQPFPRTRITVGFEINKGVSNVLAQRPVPLMDPALAKTRSPSDAESSKPSSIGTEKGKLFRLKYSPKPHYPLDDNRLYPIHGDVVTMITFRPDGSVIKTQIILSAPHPAFGQEVERVVKDWLVETNTGEPLDPETTVCMPFRFRPAE